MRYEQEWSNITDNPVTLQAIRGVKLPMIAKPPVQRPSREVLKERRKDPAIDAAIKVALIQVIVLNSLKLSYSLGVIGPERSTPSGRAGEGVHFPRLHSTKAGKRDRIREKVYSKPQSKWFPFCSRAGTR